MFDWDDENANHIAEHGVTPEEAEEAVTDPRRARAPAYRTATEQRLAYLGASTAGRVLYVVLTRRAGRLRVVTARDADRQEKRRYRERGK
jgi:hypothetical protein